MDTSIVGMADYIWNSKPRPCDIEITSAVHRSLRSGTSSFPTLWYKQQLLHALIITNQFDQITFWIKHVQRTPVRPIMLHGLYFETQLLKSFHFGDVVCLINREGDMMK
jgi:hypothetical protein